jgi:acyl-CoA synthetase (AMP-forming)/AMP-acid ligase II
MVFRSPWPAIEPPNCSVWEAVLGSAAAFGDKPAVIEGETGQALTYRQLVEGADRVAAGLARAGLAPGCPVAIALPNSIDFALAWFGVLRAGGWVVPMNPAYTPAEMEYQIRDSGARHLIAVPDCASALRAAVDHAFPIDGAWKEMLECQAPPPDIHSGRDDLAALPYSSGTTGKAKGVMLTHGNIVANMRQAWGAGQIHRDDVIVNMMPVYHAAGLVVVINACLGRGATVVLMRRFDLEGWLALNERYSATMLMVAPPVILAVAKSPLWNEFRLDALRRASCGAAPLGADLQKAFEDRTGLVLHQIWGMTEGSAMISVDSGDSTRRKLGSCGYLIPSSEGRVVDVVTGRDLGPNEIGELWLCGPNVMKGYWKQPQATSDTLVGDGWMRTGDLGYFDDDGCVFLVDRLKELIKYKALQVAPAELEDILQAHPAVLDAAVVGAPDEAAGEIPMAFVVKRDGFVLSAAELMEYVAARVAPHKKVRAVEFVEQIPKSPTGKILRRVLKERCRASWMAKAPAPL